MTTTPPRFAGRTIVVTGAGRGLGLEIARRLGQEAATVVIAELSRERGDHAVRLLKEDGVDARFVPADVTSVDSVTELADRVLADGPVWGLVNNAAMADAVGGKLVHEIEVEEFDQLMRVNARGPWLVSRAFIPHMIEQGRGRIVNLASDTFHIGSRRLAHYVTSKGAVVGLTRAMARDLGGAGITVNAVAPGIVLTESTACVPRERHQMYADHRALDRPQNPQDVSGTVAFLLSDDAAYITGSTLVVDGGFVMV